MSSFLKTALAIFLLIIVYFLYASPSLPDCDDQLVINTVLDSVRQELAKNFGEAEISKIKLSVEEISEVSKDEKAGRCSCLGVLVIDAPDEYTRLNAEYTISPGSKRGEYQVLTQMRER